MVNLISNLKLFMFILTYSLSTVSKKIILGAIYLYIRLKNTNLTLGIEPKTLACETKTVPIHHCLRKRKRGLFVGGLEGTKPPFLYEVSGVVVPSSVRMPKFWGRFPC